jgi:hypothetical protein
MRKPAVRFAGLLAFAVGCGGKTDPGGGSGTLFVLAEISGKPDSTSIEIEVKARGNPVVGANVVLEDVDRGKTATAEGRAAGLYRAAIEGYARTLSLRIVSGDDDLDAQLEGPAPHTITRPGNDAIVRRKDFDTLLVQWEADEPADAVEIVPQGSDPISIDGDPFEFRIPLGGLESGEHKLSVTRETSVDLRGGDSGSRMRTRYTVDNRFTLEG